MKTSENTNELSKALAAAQKVIKNPPKNKINPHFQSSYVDLSDGLDTIREALSAQGVALIQGTEMIEGFIFLNTRLTHASGQWIESTYPVGAVGDRPQALGSAMTYARRYSLFGMVGVAGEDDDDGNAAEESAKNEPQKARGKPQKQAVPGFTPDESATVYKTMRGVLDMCKNKVDLAEWAANNSELKNRLLPEHAKMISDDFAAYQKAIMKNG